MVGHHIFKMDFLVYGGNVLFTIKQTMHHIIMFLDSCKIHFIRRVFTLYVGCQGPLRTCNLLCVKCMVTEKQTVESG